MVEIIDTIAQEAKTNPSDISKYISRNIAKRENAVKEAKKKNLFVLSFANIESPRKQIAITR